MTDKNPAARDLVAEARAALERLRGYAAGHSGEINGAIDRIGNFIDAQTGGRFAGKVDKAQSFARRQVDHLTGAASEPGPAPQPDPFRIDDEPPAPGATAWKQPPGQAEKAVADTAATAKAELLAAVDRLRTFASDHKENLSGLVDKVGDFVDAQTGGKYAERIDRMQAQAKEQLDKHLKRPDA